MTTSYYSWGNTSADAYWLYRNSSGANSPLPKLTENTYHCEIIRMQREKRQVYDWYSGAFLGDGYSFSALYGTKNWTALDELALLGKLTEQIREHNFNAGVFGAEFKESLGTIVNTTRAFASLLSNFVRGNWAGVGRALGRVPGQSTKSAARRLQAGDISGAWLAIRYGWQPMLQDIYEAAKFVESRTSTPRKLVYRASHTVSSYFDDSASSDCTLMNKAVRTCKYKYTLLEQVSVARSLGLLNPATVLWEKLPFSFVVDWFIPIGNYLDSVGFFKGLTGSWVKSDFRRSVESVTRRAADRPGYFRFKGGDIRVTHIIFDRTVGTSLAVPFPSRKEISRALSLGHIENAAALMHQLIPSMYASIRART